MTTARLCEKRRKKTLLTTKQNKTNKKQEIKNKKELRVLKAGKCCTAGGVW